MAITVKLKKTDKYLRLPREEAKLLVKKGKARFADKAEWKRWQQKQQQINNNLGEYCG